MCLFNWKATFRASLWPVKVAQTATRCLVEPMTKAVGHVKAMKHVKAMAIYGIARIRFAHNARTRSIATCGLPAKFMPP